VVGEHISVGTPQWVLSSAIARTPANQSAWPRKKRFFKESAMSIGELSGASGSEFLKWSSR
jgi:hypothetical protein